MLRFMLDTNLCIRVLRDRPQSVRERFNLEQPFGTAAKADAVLKWLNTAQGLSAGKLDLSGGRRRKTKRRTARL